MTTSLSFYAQVKNIMLSLHFKGSSGVYGNRLLEKRKKFYRYLLERYENRDDFDHWRPGGGLFSMQRPVVLSCICGYSAGESVMKLSQ